MPALLGVFFGALISLIGHIVFRVLISLAIGYITYTGVSTSLNWFMDMAVTQFDALPREIYNIVALTKIGSVISIITSALTIRLVLSGLKTASGSISKFGNVSGS